MTEPTGCSNLRAILLFTSSRSGAKIVLEVPGSSKDDDNKETVKDLQNEKPSDIDRGTLTRTISKLSIQHVQHTATPAPPAETILGFQVHVLEKLLDAARWSDGKRLEISVGNLTFVGQPCFAYENGLWTRQKVNTVDEQKLQLVNTINTKELVQSQAGSFTHAADSFDSGLSGTSLATSTDSASIRSGAVMNNLLMFNVVVVLQQPSTQTEGLMLAEEVYEHVCQPLTKALRHLQEQHCYVEVETKRITMITSKLKKETSQKLTTSICQDSELAWSINELYTALSHGNIATLRLHGIEMALQIPHANTILPLPSTALSSALLLLENKTKLLRSLESHSDAMAMAFFITHLVPTKSLSKIATKLSLPTNAVLFMVEHLIKWRKARLITTLHARNTYVVDPRATLERLEVVVEDYGKKFPTLPSLTTMLEMLSSGRPIVYGSCFPTSRVHRELYMDALAWMVSESLILRLNTYGWIRIVSTATSTDDDDSASTISDSGTAFRPADQSDDTHTSLILHPASMTASEMQAIQRVRQSLGDQEVKETFMQIIKYFDGEHALEDITAFESLKRSKVEECLSKLASSNALQTFQAPSRA